MPIPKKALVIEGGGMRSAYASGALVALHDLGLRDFDVIAGTSAGAACAINFVGGHPIRNFKILHEYLAGPRFIRYRNLFSKKNIVDVDYLLDEVLKKEIPLPLEEFLKGEARVYINTTDCSSGQAVYFEAREPGLVEHLRASCAMPYLYRRKVILNGRRHVDGGVSASIPIEKALQEKCDEIIVIGTRPKGYRKKPNPVGFLNYLFFPRYPNLAKALNQRWKIYNDTLDWLENPPANVKVILIRPEGKLSVGRTTRDPKKIKAAYEMGYRDAQKALKK
ncbi:MAG: patatin family protein [Deltaproteobacteria bacterium]|nr:patatin family protein [Deltaproteobacteria bacterium]